MIGAAQYGAVEAPIAPYSRAGKFETLKVMQVARSFSELTTGLSTERRARIDARKAELVAEMDLADLRRALDLTQATLAETLGVGQAEVSKIEKRADILVSTLRRFIDAMGGELEIRAVFPDRVVAIRDFAGLRNSEDTTTG